MDRAFSSGCCWTRSGAPAAIDRVPGAGEGESGEADHLRATAALNRLQPRRSLILWITDLAETAMRPEVIDGAVQLLRRHVLLFVAMAQPELSRLHRLAEECGPDVRAAAAQEMAGGARAAGAIARARRADAGPESGGADFVGAESVPGGEGTAMV